MFFRGFLFATALIGCLAGGGVADVARAQVQRVAIEAPIIAPAPVPAVRPLKLGDLPGRWVGTGELTFAGGVRDVLKCRITYFGKEGSQLNQSIRCKSDNLRLEIKTRIVDFPRGEITGEWKDRVYDIGGRIKGRIVGQGIRAEIMGRSLNAELNVVVDGDQQTIELLPRNSMIRSMRIKLARG